MTTSHTSANRVHLHTVLRTLDQIPRFARSFRYAHTLAAILAYTRKETMTSMFLSRSYS